MEGLKSWEIVLIVVGVIALLAVLLYLIRWYVKRGTYRGQAGMFGKTVVITGGNAGIGKETARDLLRRGARVVILSRNKKRGEEAIKDLQKDAESSNHLGLYALDLADLDSVRDCAKLLNEGEKRIDVLINNAGIMATPEMQTMQGHELQFGTNHLGHFLLTLLLLEKLKQSAPSRIVTVSSLVHTMRGQMFWDDLNMKKKGYDASLAYGQSKLANILFTKALAKKLQGTNVTTYALHPGVVQTELSRHIGDAYGRFASFLWNSMNFFYKTPVEGAQTSIYCAVEPSLAQHTGRYYSGCAEKSPSRRALDPNDAERLWIVSLDLVGLKSDFQV